jgi:hypothetical protein
VSCRQAVNGRFGANGTSASQSGRSAVHPTWPIPFALADVGFGAISLKKSKNRALRKLVKLQSDATSPLNTISDPLRASHAAQSTNWLVPQLIF